MYAYEQQSGPAGQPTSANAFLQGNSYHAPDRGTFSGMNVIDMRMHMDFGDHLAGDVRASQFSRADSASGEVATTLEKPLVRHVQRLNQIRRAIPALQMGQYSTEGISGGMAFKRRYPSGTTDSFALVAVTHGATFTGVPDGTYTDAVTGDTLVVTGGTLTVAAPAGATSGSTS